MKILFTGGRAPATLELARNFGRNGYEVHVADSITPVLSQFSNAVKAFHILHAPRFEESLFVEDLIRILNDNGIDILFPTCEEIFWIARNREKIAARCSAYLLCDDIKKLSLLHNKHEFIKFAQSQGIPAPNTEIYSANTAIASKSVIKPVFSRFGEEVTIWEAGTFPKLSYADGRQYVLQRFIEGESVCSYGFAENGELTFNICYRRPLTTKKACTIFEPYECIAINEFVKSIVKQLRFTGNISFDFIRKDGLYFVIECNPRVTSGVHVIRKNDFTQLYFGNHKIQEINKAQLLFPTLILGHTVKFYNDVIFNAQDWKPFFYQAACLHKLVSISRKHQISLTAASVFDIEWNW